MRQTLRWLRIPGSAIALCGLTFAAYILLFTTVPRPTANNTDVVSGEVASVFEGGENDLVIFLVGYERVYYINRGIERGLQLQRFSQELEGQSVDLHVIQRMWSPLDPSHRLAPVAQVTIENNGNRPRKLKKN